MVEALKEVIWDALAMGNLDLVSLFKAFTRGDEESHTDLLRLPSPIPTSCFQRMDTPPHTPAENIDAFFNV